MENFGRHGEITREHKNIVLRMTKRNGFGVKTSYVV